MVKELKNENIQRKTTGLFIAGGNIKQYNHSGRVQQFLKKQNMKCHASCPLHFEAFIPEDNNLYSHKTKQNKINGHSSFIQNNQELGKLQEPSLGERLNKVWYIHTMEYNLVPERGEVLTHNCTSIQRITLSTMTRPNSVLYSSISICFKWKKEKVWIWRIAVQVWSRRDFSGEWICSESCLYQYQYPGCEVLQDRASKGTEERYSENLFLTVTCQPKITSKAKTVTKTKCQAVIADRRPSGMRESYTLQLPKKELKAKNENIHTHTPVNSNRFSKDHPEEISANEISFRADRWTIWHQDTWSGVKETNTLRAQQGKSHVSPTLQLQVTIWSKKN